MEFEAGRTERRGSTSGTGDIPVLPGAGRAADLACLMSGSRKHTARFRQSLTPVQLRAGAGPVADRINYPDRTNGPARQ